MKFKPFLSIKNKMEYDSFVQTKLSYSILFDFSALAEKPSLTLNS